MHECGVSQKLESLQASFVVRTVCPRRTPHPVIVTIRDNRDYLGVLLYPYYTTITGRGVLLMYAFGREKGV